MFPFEDLSNIKVTSVGEWDTSFPKVFLLGCPGFSDLISFNINLFVAVLPVFLFTNCTVAIPFSSSKSVTTPIFFLSLALTLLPISIGASKSPSSIISSAKALESISSGPVKILPLPLAFCIVSTKAPPPAERAAPAIAPIPVCSAFFS